GLLLTTKDTLANTGVNSYIFVSKLFAKRLIKYIYLERYKDFELRYVGGYDNNESFI
ncbi:hypothetical protein QBC39DRAFT_247984, partial [Podospora conica]